MADALSRATQCLRDAQSRAKQKADKSRRHVQYAVGDKVLLSVKNLHIKHPGSRKLLPRYIGPYKVTEIINPVAVRLELPPTVRVHPVFHVNLLRPHTADVGRGIKPAPPIEVNGALEYEVGEILSHYTRKYRGVERTRYLVQFKGYGPEHNEWLPEANLANAPESLADYWAAVRAKEARKRKRAQDAAAVQADGVVALAELATTCDATHGVPAQRWGRGKRRKGA